VGTAGLSAKLSGLDCRLIDQHDGNIVLHPVDPVALGTLQVLGILAVLQRLFARGTDQDVEQFFRDHAEHCTTVNWVRAFRQPGSVRFSCMPARILDGTKIASEIRREVAEEVKTMAAAGVRPGLAVVLVGHNPASEVYVRGKVKACREVGIYSEEQKPAETVTTSELLALIDKLNRSEEIDGILVQLPLPSQIDSKKILLAIDPAKDVDGFHPINVGLLSTQSPGLVPCTPAGVMEILKRSNIPISGQDAVVVGRSDIVGKPAAMLLLNANATVMVCHSKTRDLAAECRRADILVAAIGRAGMITRDFVKPGATVIDVGMNKVTDPAVFQRLFGGRLYQNGKREDIFRTKGSTLAGDVHPEVAEVAGALTPVPGGVGPLTIAMLMYNTVKAAKMRRGRRS
jgi:methylenetetrahydrofolate dehydrogenase (NADP+) / methenyltetrahydrofolate cyclohydrolase